MKYYSTSRPISPGCYPKTVPVKEIFNYNERTMCDSLHREVWGYIIYDGELSTREAEEYELVKENDSWYQLSFDLAKFVNTLHPDAEYTADEIYALLLTGDADLIHNILKSATDEMHMQAQSLWSRVKNFCQ